MARNNLPTYDVEVVQPGDTLDTFCQRHEVDSREVVRLNENEMRDMAAARGFTHSFVRHVPDPDGPTVHDDPPIPIRKKVDYHVFAGEQLKVREYAPE